ncbi:MAG: CBS domain-containing protein [Magnetococcales bacterium]|nr:CBS domain-containing protein [Magnetococcales bacterium]
MKAKDIMTRDMVTVNQDTPVRQVIAMLTQNRISGMPVLDDEECLLGIVTEKDLVDTAKELHLPIIINILDAIVPVVGERQYEEDLRKMTAVKVVDVMTANPVTVDADTDMRKVATILSEQVSFLPVVENNELVGVITKQDVLKGMLAEDV